jgi:hypothetical protein
MQQIKCDNCGSIAIKIDGIIAKCEHCSCQYSIQKVDSVDLSIKDVIKGDMQTLHVNNCIIKGDMNTVYGNYNTIKGDMNTSYGKGNISKGDMNTTVQR